MIKLTKLNKYFNRGKTNEIHVINNTSITFPEKGLVALTGPSGCGKTTLLNVIGGLDKFSSGSVDFDGTVLSYYSPEKWDIIRNKYVGYIFQNYNLINDKTVYENVEIALNMAGLYKADEIEERINYVLKSVGMYNFRKRSVLALSGGQQQRVAIARAIAKNPKVVLADEPTGNLDANNTFEVMGLIKKISQTCLVILVTHEKELVDFYADRVLELRDGVIINDYINEGNRTLEHVDDRNIYLKDLQKEEIESPLPLDYYYLSHPGSSPKIQVIYTNNTFYVKANTKAKVIYLNSDTEVRLIDDHYRKPETEDAHKSSFDLTQFGEIKFDQARRSFIRFRDTLIAGFKKVFSGRKFFGKLFLIIYFAISALIVYNLASFGSLTNADEKEFLTIGRNLISVTIKDDTTLADIKNLIEETEADQIVPYTSQLYMTLYIESFYQASGLRGAQVNTQIFPMSVSQIDANDLIIGALPADNKSVAIDKWVANSIIESKQASDIGLTKIEDLIGEELGYYGIDRMVITGIVETESPIMVVTDNNYLAFAQKNFKSQGEMAGDYTISSGRDIQAPGEILMHSSTSSLLGSTIIFNDLTLTVVGKYDNDMYFSPILHNSDATDIILNQIISSFGMYYQDYLYLYSDKVSQTISQLSTLEYEAKDAYELARLDYIANMREQITGRVTSILVTVGGIIVYIFFMMRSSMLGRIKEIGIYRSIGATKKDIYKIFFSEILAFTTIGSLTGYLFMTYIVLQIQKTFGAIVDIFYFPFTLFIGGIAGLYLINIIFGMIPIFTLLRKTPSEINAKFDI